MRAVAAAVAAFGLVMTGAAPSSAGTVTQHKEVDTFADYVPCVTDFPSLEAFLITATVNGVEHSSENASSGHFTFTQTGTVTAVPVFLADVDGDGEPDFDEATDSYSVAGPREGESFTGRFTIWGGGNFNRSGIVASTFTFSGRATGDEGTQVKWNSVDHVTSLGDPFEDPSALVKVAFSNFHCH